MAKLTGTDVELRARCAVTGVGALGAFGRDGLAHAFPAEDSQRGRWPRAVCSYTVPPAALGPATVVSPRCARCVLAVAAAGTARHRRDRPGACAGPRSAASGSGAVNATPGHGGRDAGADAVVVSAARPVALVRYRPRVAGETARTVHVVPLPVDGPVGVVDAVCGAALLLDDIETVTPGEGMPCTVCIITHTTGATPTEEPPAGGTDGAGFAAGEVACQAWGWPVTVHGDQVRLSLYHEVSATTIPIALCTEVTAILTRRRCAPAVLAHPYTPDHHIILTGERYGVTLPWPHQVHQVTGALLLPPTVTPHGPITWTRPPQQDSLRLCREIDLLGALRTALSDCPPGNPSPKDPPVPR